MRRQSATTWLIAIFVLALGAMGMARDLHAASHASAESHATCVADLHDASPASLPLDSSDDEPDCPTCDLLAVLAKSTITQAATTVAEPAPAVTFATECAPAEPIVVELINDNRTRGPPAVLRCAV